MNRYITITEGENNMNIGWYKLLAAVTATPLLALSAGAGLITLTAELEKPVLPADTRQDALIKIAIVAPEGTVEKTQRAALNLAIVLDRSGSMGSQHKLEKARDAAVEAVKMLRDGDVFSLVVYDDNVNTLVDAVPVNEERKTDIVEQIRRIQPGGSTALFAGVSVGANELRKNSRENFVNRLILLSDGLANVGPGTPQELGRLGGSLIKEKISVSTVGVGSDYNEDLMTALSQNSDGNFYFVENSNDLPLIFSKELGSALKVAAKSIRVRITCPEGVRPKGILGHECRINGNTLEMDFNQVYRGHEKSLILEVEAPPRPDGAGEELATVEVNCTAADGSSADRLQHRIIASFTADRSRVASNINRKVQADIAVQQGAVLREAALKDADAGNFGAAQEKLKTAAQNINAAAAATGDAGLKKQAEALTKRQDELSQSRNNPTLYKEVRKKTKGESYQYRNAQIYNQAEQ